MNQPGLQWCKMPGCKRACRLEQSIRTGYCEGCRLRTIPHPDERDVCPDPDAERDLKPEPRQETAMSMGGDLQVEAMDRARESLAKLTESDARQVMAEYYGARGWAEELTRAGHPEFHRILDEMRALHVKKAADYGTSADPIANCHSFGEWGVQPSKGMMMRVGEKVQRLKAFCTNGNLQNEGIEDSLKDIVGCAILALICYREEQVK